MCGIFGIIAKEGSTYTPKLLHNSLRKLALLSESRGKDSSGICFRNHDKEKYNVLKGDIPVSKLVKKEKYDQYLKESTDFDKSKLTQPFAAFGHARLVTNGSQLNAENNQPVIKDGLIGVHNGIIVNVDELWKEHTDLERSYDIDTEVMLALSRKKASNGNGTADAVSQTINSIFGTVATALFFDDRNECTLATNNGSLYILTNRKDLVAFSSEAYILKKLIEYKDLEEKVGDYFISQVHPNTGYHLQIDDFTLKEFSLNGQRAPETKNNPGSQQKKFDIQVESVSNETYDKSVLVNIEDFKNNPEVQHQANLLEYHWDRISNLKRCTKCLLPETFPFIEFDNEGVCNYCHNYKIKNNPKPIEELQKLVEPYKKQNGQPDVLVPFSGGRDSTYTLHLVKNKLGLNPIAFTYDWGMVTDLARRNIARVCGKLGVENIIVAADIHWKRENIRKNIATWLKNPALGMIPLFMAGDKFFFYYANKIKKQNNIDLNIWGINYLENTDFKTGFAGLPPKFDKKRIYSLSLMNQLKLFGFVGKNVIQSPGYINQSILDSLGSFASRYIAPKKDYYHMFDYYRWDENELEDLILNEYQWEKAVDTKSTWRIGDGTASFYNYVYTTVAGFCENDTFRSNQIREGMISRERALELIEEENKPRFESLKWYLEIIGLDFEDTIKRINAIPKMY